MARPIGRLTALAVKKAAKPGMYADGGGLYLQVTNSGARTWIYRYMLKGRAREMGLGSERDVTLVEAREKAASARKLRGEGIDPIEARDARRQQDQLDAARSKTFKEAADEYIEDHEGGWRNAKHRQQWRNTLKTYADPVLGDVSVAKIDQELVLKAIKPIWQTKNETANRVRQRIESVLDYSRVRKWRTGENPARWRGHLELVLPPRSRVRRVRNHPALPYEKMGEFMRDLRQQPGVAARGLEFLILTAARTGETIGAEGPELDLSENVWTVPAERMKAGKEHRVPLSPAAVAVVKPFAKAEGFVFPGWSKGEPLSNMAFAALLKRMGRTGITVHGFRSTFRDWAAECTNFPREVAEAALAHTLESKVEAAYRRGDLFEKRRKLMEAWATYCSTLKIGGKVVPLKTAKG